MAYLTATKQRRVSQIASSMAPLKGLNDIDPFAAMPEGFCIQLNNWFANTTSLQSRRGYKQWATGLTGAVGTLIEFPLGDGSTKLLATTNAGVYDVSVPVESPPIAHPLTSGLVSWISFANTSGQYIVGCNGVDPAFLYDGTNYTNFSQVLTPVTPGQISGVDPSSFSSVISFKSRIWFVQRNSLVAWYLDTDAVGGVATPFYFGGIFQRGGYIVDVGTWSFDAGNGLDDKLVIRTSAGEVAVYAGNNPNDPDDWALESLFYVSSPMGTVNSSVDFGGDLLMMCSSGVIPMSTVAQGAATTPLEARTLTRYISRTLSRLATSTTAISNWGLFNVQTIDALVVVIPASLSEAPQQFVMNSLTGAWSRFTLPASCFSLYGRNIMFGGDNGDVYSYEGQLDNVRWDGTGGVPIELSLFTAFNYFGDPTTIKSFKLLRPIFQSTKPVSYLINVSVDYDLQELAGNPYPPEDLSAFYLWDSAIWDEGRWGAGITVYRPWVGITGVGFCAAALIKVLSDRNVALAALEVVYEPGGAI